MTDTNSESSVSAQQRRDYRPSPVAAVAIALSLCALLVSVLEVSSIRREQRVGVWPYIDVSMRFAGEGFEVSATNKGIGPALVRSVVLMRNGVPIESLDAMILETVGPDLAFSYDTYRTSDPSGSVMSPDEKSILFAVPWTDATRVFVDRLGDFSLSVCYCSVYEDCWRATLNDEVEDVSSCSAGTR